MGRNSLNSILTTAHLTQFIDHFPPDNLLREFDFADFTMLNLGLEEIYGPRGGRGMALRAGRAIFPEALKNFGTLAGVDDRRFKVLPLPSKLKIGLSAMANIFSQISDQETDVRETPDSYYYSIHRCPVCWGRERVDTPVCFITAGLLQEGLLWVSGGNEFSVKETLCAATGHGICEFEIIKEPITNR